MIKKPSIDAKHYANLVKENLESFGIDLDSDVVCSTNDGCSMMQKYAEFIKCESQLCLIHAIHLAVTKTFYQTNLQSNKQESDSESDEDNFIHSNDSQSESEFDDSDPDDIFELVESVSEILKKARSLVKYFRSSHVRFNILQQYVKLAEGKELTLKLDVRTRWNSILAMVQRILKLRPHIELALRELKEKQMLATYDDLFYENLHHINDTLSPIEECILFLGKTNTNLLQADGMIKYVFDKLDQIDSDMSRTLSELLESEIQNRRNVDIVSLLKCLHTKSQDFSSKLLCKEFKYSSKSQQIRTAQRLYHHLFLQLTERDELESTFFSSDSDQLPKKQLMDASRYLEEQFSATPSFESEESNEVDIKKEIQLMVATKKRTPKLDKLYTALLTIQPSSTSCESAFSVASSFVPKRRSKMKSDLLEALVFLKYYFLKKDNKQLSNQLKRKDLVN